MTRHEAAKKGGEACRDRHGREFYKRIGKLGYAATLARWWQGDRTGYHRWLLARGWNVVADHLADLELGRQLADGATIASVEIPVIDGDGPDDDPFMEDRAGESRFMDLYESGIPW